MGFQAGLAGFSAAMLGGLTSVPGAVVGGLLLGVGESLGAAVLGNTYRQMISFVVLILVLMIPPSGPLRRAIRAARWIPASAASSRRSGLPDPQRWLVGIAVVARWLPLVLDEPYLYRVFTVALIFSILALSLTLVAGQAGQISLGQAGFLGSAHTCPRILTTKAGYSPWLALPAGGAGGRGSSARSSPTRPCGCAGTTSPSPRSGSARSWRSRC